MTAPERFADSQIPLAPRRRPSHDRTRTLTLDSQDSSCTAGRRPYMTAPERFADSQIPLATAGAVIT